MVGMAMWLAASPVHAAGQPHQADPFETPAADAAAPLLIADGAGPTLYRGDSTRPRVEVPSNAAPSAVEHDPAPLEGVSPTPEGGERASGTRGLGTHRPGELYLPPGQHRPGDLDDQGTFRPGDLG